MIISLHSVTQTFPMTHDQWTLCLVYLNNHFNNGTQMPMSINKWRIVVLLQRPLYAGYQVQFEEMMDKHEIRLWSQTTGNINIYNCRRGTIFKYDVCGLSGWWKFRFWKSHNLESHNVSLVFKFSWRGSISHGFLLLNLFTCLFICLFVTLKADKTFTYMWPRQFRCLTHSIFAYDNPYRIYWGTLSA